MRAAPALLPLLRSSTDVPLRPLPEPGCPVRVVWGRKDRLIPFEHFGRPLLERVPSAELVHLDDAGHVPMWDRPDTVAELVLAVTRSVDGVPVDPAPTPAPVGRSPRRTDGQAPEATWSGPASTG